jgi:hypothetical protein
MLKQLQRTDPRIAVNALAEYMNANGAAKRRKIITEQKRPRRFMVAYYDLAMRPVADFLARVIDHEGLLLRRQELFHVPADTKWKVQRRNTCASAIKAVAKRSAPLELKDLIMGRTAVQQPKLILANVQISVRPELFLLRRGTGSAENERGFLKLYFGKKALNKERGESIAAIVHQYAEIHLAQQGGCARQLCSVLDVLTGKFYTAPKAIVSTRKDILEACREIGTLWQTVEVSDDSL